MAGVLDNIEADAGPVPRGSGNIRHLARTEIDGGGQIVVQDKFAYVGYQRGPRGTSILDISNPRKPEVVATIIPMSGAHSHKVRVVGDIIICNSERHPGNGVGEDFDSPGFRIFDVRDKTNPKLLSYTRTYGKGVHRFDVDENYAYISTEMEGFIGNILVIYNIRNPSKPVEVSRLWVHGQNVSAGEPPHPLRTRQRLHHGMRSGNEIYMGYWYAGVAIGDISDIARPKILAHYRFDPPAIEPMHTFMKVPHSIKSKAIAISTDEEREHRGDDAGKPHAPFRTWDVTDQARPKVVSEYRLPETASPYHGPHMRFGAHQFRETVDKDNLCYVTWFAAGLRILDISEPASPEEVGYFIPKPGDGYVQPFTNDVAKDKRGLLFVTDKARGLDVIEFLG